MIFTPLCHSTLIACREYSGYVDGVRGTVMQLQSRWCRVRYSGVVTTAWCCCPTELGRLFTLERLARTSNIHLDATGGLVASIICITTQQRPGKNASGCSSPTPRRRQIDVGFHVGFSLQIPHEVSPCALSLIDRRRQRLHTAFQQDPLERRCAGKGPANALPKGPPRKTDQRNQGRSNPAEG